MIPLFKMSNGKESTIEASKVLLRETNWAVGEEIEKFEEKLATYIGRKYAVTFNSGTSALHAMLLSYNIGDKDEVIIPSFTFIATANAVKAVGAIPVFADIEEKTYGLDIESVKSKITKNTKAIMPIHYAGCPSLYTKELRELAEEKNLLFFEDAAQSFGASIDGKRVGSFSDCAMFSFCQDKIISTGEGGVLLTNNVDVYQKLKLIRSHGRADDKDYFASHRAGNYILHGYNWRLSTIQAAIGIAQLKKAESNIFNRIHNATVYDYLLSENEKIKVFSYPSNFRHVYQKYTIRVPSNKRNTLKKILTTSSVGCKSYFDVPVHKTKYYKELLDYNISLPKTEKMSNEVISIPMFPSLKDDDIEYIAKIVKEVVQ